jgi:hypothetical protein
MAQRTIPTFPNLPTDPADASDVAALHAVPTADVVTNTNARDVIGNKADAAVQTVEATKSITAYAKGILDILAGATGVAAWPAAAAPADGVSLAEGLRYIVETQLGGLANTGGADAKLGTIIGDVLNSPLVTRIGNLQTALEGGTAAVNRAAGRSQIAVKTIDLAQAAAVYDLFTGTTQDFIVEQLIFRMPNVDASDDATITSIAIATDDATPVEFITALQGAVANLGPERQIAYPQAGNPPVLIKVGTKIQLTIAGGAADAATVCDVVVIGRAAVSGGYLAPAA